MSRKIPHAVKTKSVLIISAALFLSCLLLPSPSGPARGAVSDAIALRVMPNDQHYSPLRWYRENIQNQGSPQSLLVDGYEAVRDGRTVYANAANVDTASQKIYTNIYILSYSQQAEGVTVDIFGQLLWHWKFNTNLTAYGPGQCARSGAPCVHDADCPIDEYCTGEKAKIIRDARRLSDMAEMELLLSSYQASRGNRYPDLEAGSYLSGKSLSVWPSWQENLAKELGVKLPVDPINIIGSCTEPAGYDPATCWNEAAKKFAGEIPGNLPPGSRTYIYLFDAVKKQYASCAIMESNHAKNYIGMACGGEAIREIFGQLTNHPPRLEPESVLGSETAIINAQSGQPLDFYLKASDIDNDTLRWTISYTDSESYWVNRRWLARPILENVWTVNTKKLHAESAGRGGDYQLRIKVEDGRGGEKTVNYILRVGNLSSIISAADVSVVVGHNDLETKPLTVTVSDQENHYPLTVDFDPNTLPRGLTWNTLDTAGPNLYSVKGIPSQNQSELSLVYRLMLTAKDNYSSETQKEVKITIINNPPRLNSITCPSSVRVNNPYACSSIRADDLKDNHQITGFSYTGLPTGITAGNPIAAVETQGSLSGRPANAGEYSISAQAVDQYGAMSQAKSFNLKVNTYCGDGTRQSANMEGGAEVCDCAEDNGQAVACGNEACQNAAGYKGIKSCTADCQWGNCVMIESCGDNKKNGPEICDGSDGVAGAPNESSANKQYACNASCALTGGWCGDGIINPGYEECENANLVEVPVIPTCQSAGGIETMCGNKTCCRFDGNTCPGGWEPNGWATYRGTTYRMTFGEPCNSGGNSRRDPSCPVYDSNSETLTSTVSGQAWSNNPPPVGPPISYKCTGAGQGCETAYDGCCGAPDGLKPDKIQIGCGFIQPEYVCSKCRWTGGYCGDGKCGSKDNTYSTDDAETCSTCDSDCGSCCTPITTCEPNWCHNHDNGCGVNIDCGQCPNGAPCGANGTCCQATCNGRDCGTWDNGCGGTINCGTCNAPFTCQDGYCCLASGDSCNNCPGDVYSWSGRSWCFKYCLSQAAGSGCTEKCGTGWCGAACCTQPGAYGCNIQCTP